MVRKIAIGVAAVVVIVIALVAFYVFRPPAQASGPIQAIPIGTSAAATSAPAATAAAATSAPAAEATTGAATSAPVAAATSESATSTPAEAAAGAPVVFEIVSAESEARFLIDEVLRGNPVTVVGKTDQVAGQIAIDPSNPQNSQVGIIQVDVRALATDNEFRNRAIKNAILRTDDFEYVSFKPTAITGLPEKGAVGQSYTFQIQGDLTITDVTKPVTFDVTATAESETRLKGTATASFPYRDFNLNIPDSPSVDTVADSVRLELDFVAQPVQ
ncbi:YceI family protein [Chloroflexia bacterium SDU3-3]|nr:YceI family protein [Chloroflexia bacterium SDU3-3]